MLISDIAEQLNKDYCEVFTLCECNNIKINYNDNGQAYINEPDATKLLVRETETPTRYTKHGRECKDIIKDIIGSEGVQNFYIGNIMKYLYRNNSIGDLKKARTYLGMLIKEVEDNDSNE